MAANEYRIIVRLPKADGVHHRSDRELAEDVGRAIEEGLRDRYVVIDHLVIGKVPPPRDRADLPIGARVLVTPFPVEESEPYAARVAGYDMHRSKYRLDRQWGDGHYSSGGHTWAFVNQVEVHPDGPDAGKES
jgi:hypothetical protein